MSPPRHTGLDEDDVRIRAARGSRPRTRRRPAHEQAASAFVAGVDRGRYRCVLGDHIVTAMKARELGRGNIVVGDTVGLIGDVSGAPGTLARVVRVEPRRSVLRRSADDTDPVERAIVANADQMLIVSSLADPAPSLRLIDRFLVAAYDAEIEPVLCLTKSDLASPDEVLPVYAPLGVRFIVLGRPASGDSGGSSPREAASGGSGGSSPREAASEGSGGSSPREAASEGSGGSSPREALRESALTELRGVLAGQISVLVGSSGVGKSTLVNMLIPDAARAVGIVSPVTGRGRHTSSSVVALPLPGDEGWIIDTPGLRSFGLGHMSPENVVAAFPDLADFTVECPPGCDHLGPGCAFDAAASPDSALAARLDSLRRLLRSLEGTDGSDGDDRPATDRL